MVRSIADTLLYLTHYKSQNRKIWRKLTFYGGHALISKSFEFIDQLTKYNNQTLSSKVSNLIFQNNLFWHFTMFQFMVISMSKQLQ